MSRAWYVFWGLKDRDLVFSVIGNWVNIRLFKLWLVLRDFKVVHNLSPADHESKEQVRKDAKHGEKDVGVLSRKEERQKKNGFEEHKRCHDNHGHNHLGLEAKTYRVHVPVAYHERVGDLWILQTNSTDLAREACLEKSMARNADDS